MREPQEDTSSAGAQQWGALVVEVPEPLEDELCGELGRSSQGIEIASAGRGRSRLTICLSSPERAAACRAAAAAILHRHGLDPADCGLRVEAIADGRWVERYQALLRPFALGARFMVFPSGRIDESGTRVPLRLVPGRAFGTGEHATTQLCVERLERWVRPASRWLDLGCGTGVLGMVCHHCGAGEVLGLDDDAEAVVVAREVLAANGLAAAVRVGLGSADSAPQACWDGVVANIGAAFFRNGASATVNLLRPGGLLLATGFVVDDLPEMERLFADAGLVDIEHDLREPWVLLAGSRAGR